MLNNEKNKKKKPQLSLQLFFLAEDEGFDYQQGVAGALPGEQQSRGLLHLIGSNPSPLQIKNADTLAAASKMDLCPHPYRARS